MRYQSFYPFSNQQQPMRQMPPASQLPPGSQPFPQGMGMQQNSGFQQANNQQMRAGVGAGADGPSRADQYMQTANRFLNTAQQFAPLVQQFAPMIQNLPAMWKLYKGFQAMPDASAPPSIARGNTPTPPASSGPRPIVEQPSSPRIFQPPF